MKKGLALLVVMALCLVNVGAFAQSTQDFSGCLYPIREGGLWGYMNYAGETVIQPQYAYCGEMRGVGYALFGLNDADGGEKAEGEDGWHFNEGILDKDGNIVVEPKYIIDEGYDGFYYGGRDTGVCHMLAEDESFGFFNVVTGYFSGAVYRAVANQPSEGLIQVEAPDENGGYFIGYADAATGEMVIPPQYDMSVEDGDFINGYASVQATDESGLTKTCLIDRQNNRVSMPQGCEPAPYAFVSEGLIAVTELKTGLCGYADLNGNLVIQPIYTEASSFDQGVAKVMRSEAAGWEYIDGQGQPAQEPPEREYLADGAWLELEENEAGEEMAQVVDEKGNVLLPYSAGYVFSRSYDFGYENFFSEGYQVLCKDDLYGFVDEKGQIAIPFIYEDAMNFSNGLAQVHVDGRMGYIDYQGKMVWQEQ